MQVMRYINLFEKISRVSTKNCFIYNNSIIFAVPERLVSKAVGKNGENVKKTGEILSKKIKIIPLLEEDGNIERFVMNIVEPVTFNRIDVKDGEAIITAGKQSKAALIGRNRIREEELANILKGYLGIKKLRIV